MNEATLIAGVIGRGSDGERDRRSRVLAGHSLRGIAAILATAEADRASSWAP